MAFKMKGFSPFTRPIRFDSYIHRGPNPARGQKRRKAWNKIKSSVRDIFTKKNRSGSNLKRSVTPKYDVYVAPLPGLSRQKTRQQQTHVSQTNFKVTKK